MVCQWSTIDIGFIGCGFTRDIVLDIFLSCGLDDFQILVNYQEHIDINFYFLVKHGWVKFRNFTGHCGSQDDLQILGMYLQILTTY